MKRRTFIAAAATGLLAATSMAASAQDYSSYPERQIRLVIPYSPGGATDIIFRLVAQEMEKDLGVTIVPVNMPGASTTLGSREVRDAEPDGYTILGSHDVIATTYITGVVDYSFEAFAPISLITQTPNIATLNADVGVKTLADLKNYVSEHPGELTWGITPGSTSHFFVAMMLEALDLPPDSLRLIDYEGTGSALAALQRGEIAGTMANYTSARAQIEEGTFFPLAVAGTERLPQLPDTATFIESGYDLEHATSRGLFAPKDTPKPIVDRLAKALHAASQSPEFKAKIESELGSIVRYLPPAEYTEFVQRVQENLSRTASQVQM
jgi:tripartite-type tricarboxylate transporter receptor subunit TctC